MKTVCKKDMCTGCGACIEVCPCNAIRIEDNIAAYNRVIDSSICKDCHACYRVCPNNANHQLVKPIRWYQGWAKDEITRKEGSSGGLALALAKEFIKSGGTFCSCAFENGEFIFSFAHSMDELAKFAGSKYVKSNPLGIYKSIKQMLKAGKSVLFLGLPCQVAALKNFIGISNAENLYTIDLICHGTPSPKLLESFLSQYGITLKGIKNIKFREKTYFHMYKNDSNTYESIISDGILDCYLMAFLNCLDYTENCYHCKYARLERISDITIGDSWGSEQSVEEQKKGISLILCQTQKGIDLVEKSNLCLKEVDLEKAVKNNGQLNSPSEKPDKRKIFLQEIGKGKRFNTAVRKCFPKKFYRQKLKEILMKIHLVRADCPKT